MISRPTLYVQRIRNFIRAERILHVTRVIVLVTSLHVSQNQSIIGSKRVRPVKLVPSSDVHFIHRFRSTQIRRYTYFDCNFMSARRHSTVG